MNKEEKNRDSLIMYPAWFLILGFLFGYLIVEVKSVVLGVALLLIFFIIYVVMLKSHRNQLDIFYEFCLSDAKGRVSE